MSRDRSADAPRRKNWFRRHKFLTALLVLVGLAWLLSLGGTDEEPAAPDSTPDSSATSSGDSDPAPAAGDGTQESEDSPEGGDRESEDGTKVAAVGDKVSAGDFEYVVTSVKPGVPQIGDSTFGQKAQGQFVLVELTVTNTGKEAQMFDDSEHRLVDSQGREHSTDTEAAIYVPNNDSFLEDVNPGNTLKGTIVFDVPKDAEPQQLKLKGPGFWDPEEAVVTLD